MDFVKIQFEVDYQTVDFKKPSDWSKMKANKLDFYEPQKHTEVSIKRARKAYPPSPDTKHVKSTLLPLADKSVDNLFVIFSAHEIRDSNERISFFSRSSIELSNRQDKF